MDRASILTQYNATWAFVQPVLDFLTLNIGTEVTRDIDQPVQTKDHLRRIAHISNNQVQLQIQDLDL